MNYKTLITLDFDKIRTIISSFTQYSVAAEKALKIVPITNIDEIHKRQTYIQESLDALEKLGISIGGARDIRHSIKAALHADILTPQELLDIRSTIEAACDIKRLFEKYKGFFPHLYELTSNIELPQNLLNNIIKSISERGEITDQASPMLGKIRNEIQVTYRRINEKLESIIHDSSVSSMLQESIVTQRDGRFVIPLKAEFKGRIKAIIHDQSASGATLFIEPLSILELNNQYRELLLEERDEVRRILKDLSEQVAAQSILLSQLVDHLSDIDLFLGCAKFAQAYKCNCPKIIDPRKSTEKLQHSNEKYPITSPIIRFWQARHPLLDQNTVVPIDFTLDSEHYAVIITGPNTGGKTISLKTIGLLIQMAQAGLFIPAQEGSEFTLFQDVLADIGDEQSIEQSLSTFSAHIKNIKYILKKANKNTLVLLDELGAGTDPQEGAALGRAILTYLIEKKVPLVITTHHPELKVFAHKTKGAINANVEFDIETLRPTYRLIIGLPGHSNALAIAEKLGLPPQIISNARQYISPQAEQTEELLSDIQKQRELIYKTQLEVEQKRKEIYQLQCELANHIKNIEKERAEIINQAREKAEKELETLKEEIRKWRKKNFTSSISKSNEETFIRSLSDTFVKALEEENSSNVLSTNEQYLQSDDLNQSPESLSSLVVGSIVKLPHLGAKGEIISIDGENAEVQIGQMRMKTKLSLLELIENSPLQKTNDYGIFFKPAEGFIRSPSPGVELDIRGKTVDDALSMLESHLEAAYLAGLPYIRIIHGKGSGKLKLAVRQALQQHPNVSNFEAGDSWEGGDGVTIAKLRDD